MSGKITILLAASIGSLLTSLATAASVCDPAAIKTSDKLQQCVTIENLVAHLQAFQQQANANTELPGTRFTGTAGYDASRDYIVNKMKQAGYRVSVQKVPMEITYIPAPRLFEQQSPTGKIYADNVDYSPYIGSGGGNVTAHVQTPSGDIMGCVASDFSGFASGNVALIKRGVCTTRDKVNNAIKAGASGVIIFNDTPGIMYVGLGSPIPSETTPLVFTTPEVAEELQAAMHGGELPVVHIKFSMIKRTGYSDNIIAESVGGNPDHVVMAGAHLDSSAGNSGMNDNGSASATVLEAALLMQKTQPKNKLRFAWWTGEELGLLGSNYYVSQLNAQEKARIAVYLNYEILGAPNGGRLVMDALDGVTPPGSEKITALYKDYFTSVGLKYFAFDPRMGNAAQRSDMLAFMQAGIPSGYLVTGAELPWNSILDAIFTDLSKRTVGLATHPCYHKFCDTLTLKPGELSDPNFDFDLYLQMSKAAAYAIYTYAMD